MYCRFSVGATENLRMAACLAEGDTVLDNVAREPEIIDLANFLIEAGAAIEGAGTSTIYIHGVQSLKGMSAYRVIPDRIEVGTLIIAAVITGGDVVIKHTCYANVKVLVDMLNQMGAQITYDDKYIIVKPCGDL